MSTLKKQHKDKAEIELAWSQLIQALKPLETQASKPEENSAIKTKHHPALITTNELAHWEVFG